MVEPSNKADLDAAIERLTRRSHTTYKARLKSHDRLARRNNAWNASLIALSTSTTVAAVGMLVDKKIYGTGGDALMVVLAVLSLAASLIVSSVNYGGRVRAMEANYKRIQQISLSAENSLNDGSNEAWQRYIELQKEYNIALEYSENQTDADYYRTLLKKDRPDGAGWAIARDWSISKVPYASLVVPILIFTRFIGWFFNGF